jgi:hypothetical protein
MEAEIRNEAIIKCQCIPALVGGGYASTTPSTLSLNIRKGWHLVTASLVLPQYEWIGK